MDQAISRIFDSSVGRAAIQYLPSLSLVSTDAGLKSILLGEIFYSGAFDYSNDGEAAIALAKLVAGIDVAAIKGIAVDLCALHCESPIEKMFLGALVITSLNRGAQIRNPDGASIGGVDPYYKKLLRVEPQMIVGDYRVDFHLHYWIESQLNDTGTLTIEKNAHLLVECDGHDWHDKTKEQASRDKKRDRYLQANNYTVFRFSGSDIHKNAISCAKECCDFLGLTEDGQGYFVFS